MKLSNITTRCRTCNVTYKWKKCYETRQNLQILKLTCPRCGDSKTVAVDHDEFIRNLLEVKT